MKKLSILTTILLSLVIIHFSAFAQPTPTILGRYNGPAGNNDEIRAMTVDANGFVYVTGSSDASKKGNLDFATIKYNGATGQQIWVARYNGTGNGEDWPTAIAVDAAGNVYVTGRSMGNGTNFDYATVKYNASGSQKWVARFNSFGNRSDVPYGVAVDGSGNVFVTGAADCSTSSFDGNSAATIEYDSLGNEKARDTCDMLQNIYTSTLNREQGNSISLDGNGNIYIAGNSSSSGGLIIAYTDGLHRQWVKTQSFDIHKVLVDASNNIVVSGWSGKTVKYSTSGDWIWTANGAGEAFWDMALDAAGNVYVTGGNSDYLTSKYNGIDGSQAWSKSYVGSASGPDFARSIALDASGNVYVTGHATSKSGKNGLEVMGTIKYNNAGDQQWVSLYDSTNKLISDGFVVATDLNGNVYVAGQGISSSRANDFDFVTLKYSSSSAGFVTSHLSDVSENNDMTFTLKNYPNPFVGNTVIEYKIPHDGMVNLAVYDLAGNEIAVLVNETKSAGIYNMNFDARKLSSGTYMCKIQCAGLSKTKQLIVLK